MPEQKKRILLLLPRIHLLCLPYLCLYLEFIKAFFFFVFSPFCPAASSFDTVYVGIWNRPVSKKKKKSLQIQKTTAVDSHVAVGL